MLASTTIIINKTINKEGYKIMVEEFSKVFVEKAKMTKKYGGVDALIHNNDTRSAVLLAKKKPIREIQILTYLLVSMTNIGGKRKVLKKTLKYCCRE